MTRPRPEVAVAGIAFDPAGRVLLIERGRGSARGQWTVPGGRVEGGETLAAALRREMLEETGLEVQVGALVTVFERIEADCHYVIHDHLVLVTGGALQAGDDAAAARWVAWDELSSLPLSEGLMPVLERARDLLAP